MGTVRDKLQEDAKKDNLVFEVQTEAAVNVYEPAPTTVQDNDTKSNTSK